MGAPAGGGYVANGGGSECSAAADMDVVVGAFYSPHEGVDSRMRWQSGQWRAGSSLWRSSGLGDGAVECGGGHRAAPGPVGAAAVQQQSGTGGSAALEANCKGVTRLLCGVK